VRLNADRQRALDALQAAEDELRTLRREARARATARESSAAAEEGVTPQAAPPPMPAEPAPGA
jgi:hypothetical protein